MTLPEGLPPLAPWLILGAVIAGVVAMTKATLRPPARTASAGVSLTFLSFVEDLVAFVGSLLGVLYVPLVPFLLVAFLLFFHRIRNPLYQPGSTRPGL